MVDLDAFPRGACVPYAEVLLESGGLCFRDLECFVRSQSRVGMRLRRLLRRDGFAVAVGVMVSLLSCGLLLFVLPGFWSQTGGAVFRRDTFKGVGYFCSGFFGEVLVLRSQVGLHTG